MAISRAPEINYHPATPQEAFDSALGHMSETLAALTAKVFARAAQLDRLAHIPRDLGQAEVWLMDPGPHKIPVLQAVQAALGLDFDQTWALVEMATVGPTPIFRGSPEQAARARKAMTAQGAIVEIR